MKSLSSDVRVYVGLVVFIVSCLVLFGGKEQGDDSGLEITPRRTSYSAKRTGLKALYETLDEVGYPVRRQMTSFIAPPPDGVVFMVSPEQSPSPSEWQSIKRWVEQGNVLVVAGQCPASSDPFNTHKPDPSRSTPACPSYLSPGVTEFCVEESTRIEEDDLGLAGLHGLVKPFG